MKGSAGVLACLALLASCTRGGVPPAPRSGTPGGPHAGGVLRVVLAGDVDSLDPHRAARPSSWFLARALHRGLLAFPDAPFPGGAHPAPDLAERVPAGPRVFTFRLRDGARFGPPVSRAVRASDVRASIERLVRTGSGSVPRALLGIRGAGAFAAGRAPRIAGIETPDQRTVVIRLRRPASDLPWVLAHPQAAVLPAGTPRAPAQPAGAGPYRLSLYAPQRRITLVRNDGWTRDADPVRAAWVDRIEAEVVAGPRAAVARVGDGADLVAEPGPLDLVPPPPERARVGRAATGCLRYLFLNADVAPFERRPVRRAVAHAVDRARFRAPFLVPAPRILPPTDLANRRAPVLGESVTRARAALRSAGLGRGFATTLVVGEAARDRRDARAVAEALARARIRVSIRRVPGAILYPDRYESPSARTPMGIATWCADWPGLSGRAVLGAIADPRAPRATRYSGLRAAAVARAVDEALAAPARNAPHAWARADRAAVSAAGVVPLAWVGETVVLSARLRGWTGSPAFPRGDPTALWIEG